VFLTEGLLATLKDESELAGVLAHEISHVTRQHIVKAIRQANLLEAGQDLASAAGKDIDKYAKVTDFSINILSKGLSREDELDADKHGTLLAARTGYDAKGLYRSIETLTARKQDEVFLARFGKTHPPASDRLVLIDRVIANSSLSASGAQLPDRFQQAFR